MQKILTNFSKYIILALLGCSLFIALNGTDSDFSEFTNAYVNNTVPVNATKNNTSANVKPASIWTSMSSEFKLDDRVQSPQVQTEIRVLLADHNKLIHILIASRPYIYYIHQQTQARGLPAELALIPVIESEFNPNDHSTKGARGLWQLMASTAHILGVKIKKGYDGRLNFFASTNAALVYFRDLGHEFKGNWYLAIAAYNCGQVRVESAERKTGSHNFWKLPLPEETKVYVPKLLAVAAIIKDPKKYGIQLPAIANQPYTAASNKKIIA